ncbi:AsmA family protein [Sneathiella sp.]|jgi:AsmA protein|uniref:AsmA family protein n=1 Tax=Sneathiella sp. TaxID=1964365 RepID=UPI0039E4080C
MKKVFYGILGIVVLLIVAVVAIPFLVPAERLKEELILAVNDATGRTLSIDGDFNVSVFPTLGVNASTVSLSNAPSSNEPNMVSIDTLTVELAVLPILTGQVQVDKFVLNKPVIYLESDKKGNKNWEFSSPAGTASGTSDAKTESSSDSSGGDLGISDLNLGDVQIIGGALTYNDQKTGDVQILSDINIALILTGLDAPFKAAGNAVWNAEKVDFETEIGALRAVLENKPTSLKSSVTSSKVTFTLDGGIDATQPLKLNGKTDLNIPSLKDLTAWVGQPMEAKEGTFGLVSVKGDVSINDTAYAFKNATLVFDKINGNGDFSVNLGKKIPYLEGRLDIVELDINPYLPENAGTEQNAASDTSAPAKTASDQKWDDNPIDFSGLKSANAKFDLSVGKILVQKVKIGKSSVATKLQDGVLNVDLTELDLYDGKGVGSVMLDARNPTAKVTKSFSLQGIQLLPMLTDAADFDKLEGTGKIDLKINATGKSQKDFVEALNGNGQILFENGAISGINLAAMARNVTSAFTDSGGTQKTDFAELSGTFTIVNGLLKNNDLKMLNPFVRITGKGDVNMPPKTLDYRVEPKLVATTEGQGGKDATGLVVPIKISGSWEDPKFAPDLAGAITNIADPAKLKEGLETKGKEELKKTLGDTLGKTLGGFLGKKD